MKKLVMLVLALLATVTGFAQGSKSDGPGVAGEWTLVIKGPAAHGDLSATMDLNQATRTVTGTLTAHGNTHTLAGEFREGALSLETTDVPADKVLSLNATLKDDGTLAGYLSGPMGDMQWTATRAAARK